jgi:hypothetical protein
MNSFFSINLTISYRRVEQFGQGIFSLDQCTWSVETDEAKIYKHPFIGGPRTPRTSLATPILYFEFQAGD